MQVAAEGVVWRDETGAPTLQNVCFPSVALLSDGRLLATCRVGSKKDSADGNLMFCESRDEGKTWQERGFLLSSRFQGVPGELRLGPPSELAPGRIMLVAGWVDRSDPSLPFANPDTIGILPIRVLLTESSDAGATWAPRRDVDVSPMIQPALTGPVMRLPDGRLAISYETNKHYDDPTPVEHKAALIFSEDEGAVWKDPTVVATHPDFYFWDQRHAVLPDGSMLALFWTYSVPQERDVEIHQAFSQDNGRTWSAPANTGIEGQIAFPVPLGGEDVLMLYVHRHHPPSLRAVLSHDGGETWDTGGEMVFYSKDVREAGMDAGTATADYWQDMELWTFGLPSGVVLPDGDVLVVYYAGYSRQTHMAWSRIAVG